PIITHLEGRVGSNAFWLKKTRVQHLLDYERARVFKGSGVQPTATGNIAAPAIPIVSFSHDPTRENAALGFIDCKFNQEVDSMLRSSCSCSLLGCVFLGSLCGMGGSVNAHIFILSLPVGQPGAARVLRSPGCCRPGHHQR